MAAFVVGTVVMRVRWSRLRGPYTKRSAGDAQVYCSPGGLLSGDREEEIRTEPCCGWFLFERSFLCDSSERCQRRKRGGCFLVVSLTGYVDVGLWPWCSRHPFCFSPAFCPLWHGRSVEMLQPWFLNHWTCLHRLNESYLRLHISCPIWDYTHTSSLAAPRRNPLWF